MDPAGVVNWLPTSVNVFPCVSAIEEKDGPLAKSNPTRTMSPALVFDEKASDSVLALETVPALIWTNPIAACAEATVSKPTVSISTKSKKLRLRVFFTENLLVGFQG